MFVVFSSLRFNQESRGNMLMSLTSPPTPSISVHQKDAVMFGSESSYLRSSKEEDQATDGDDWEQQVSNNGRGTALGSISFRH